MTFLRTSPPRLAAAIIGMAVTALGAPLDAQDLPLVRPSSEVFGIQATDAAKSPFSVLEPDWEAADSVSAPRELEAQQRVNAVPAYTAEDRSELIPVQSLQLPDFDPPVVEAASPQPVPPAPEAKSLPLPAAPEPSEPADLPTFEPKPVGDKSEAPSASAEDLEGMLHSMVWVTATIGIGAVVSLWMLKLWLTRGGRTMLPSKSLKLVDTLRIGPRCGVYLVQAETHRVLVGVEHGKTMCLMPLPANFTESLDAAEEESDEPAPEPGFERVADVFTALRNSERPKGATS